MAIQPDVDDFVSVPEGRLHYIKKGSGYPVVIHHAGGTSAASWLPVMDILGQHFTCYAFDIMGHGPSDQPPRESFSIPDHARTTRQAMEILNIRRAHFIGNLAGACMCIETAASYPELVDKMVLAAPPVVHPRITPQRREAFKKYWDEKGLAIVWDNEEMKAGYHFANPRQELSDELNKSRAAAGKWTRIHSFTNAWYDLVARLPFIRPTATLVINGDVIGEDYRETQDIVIYNLPNAHKVVLPNTGNFLYAEDPKGFAAAVLDFLK